MAFPLRGFAGTSHWTGMHDGSSVWKFTMFTIQQSASSITYIVITIITNLRPSPISLADLGGASQQLEPRLTVVGDLMVIVVNVVKIFENLDGIKLNDDFHDKYYI